MNSVFLLFWGYTWWSLHLKIKAVAGIMTIPVWVSSLLFLQWKPAYPSLLHEWVGLSRGHPMQAHPWSDPENVWMLIYSNWSGKAYGFSGKTGGRSKEQRCLTYFTLCPKQTWISLSFLWKDTVGELEKAVPTSLSLYCDGELDTHHIHLTLIWHFSSVSLPNQVDNFWSYSSLGKHSPEKHL